VIIIVFVYPENQLKSKFTHIDSRVRSHICLYFFYSSGRAHFTSSYLLLSETYRMQPVPLQHSLRTSPYDTTQRRTSLSTLNSPEEVRLSNDILKLRHGLVRPPLDEEVTRLHCITEIRPTAVKDQTQYCSTYTATEVYAFIISIHRTS
jgi:hypothetical protein